MMGLGQTHKQTLKVKWIYTNYQKKNWLMHIKVEIVHELFKLTKHVMIEFGKEPPPLLLYYNLW